MVTKKSTESKTKPAAMTAKKTPAKRTARRSDVIEVDEPSGTWPKIAQGSHLTVVTHENGRTELIWDDAQLLKDVQAAVATVSTAPTKKPSKKSK